MAESYFELLRRPEWQRKRLAVMQLADFCCEDCGADDKTLNVHHRFYKKGAKPWEYEDGDLVCLCEGCHGTWHGVLDSAKKTAGQLCSDDLVRAHGYMAGLWFQSIANPDADHIGKEEIGVREISYEFASGVADSYLLRGNEAIEEIIEFWGMVEIISHSVLNRMFKAQQVEIEKTAGILSGVI